MTTKKATQGAATPTLGKEVTSHGDEIKNNTFCCAIGYGYLTSGLVKVVLEQDGVTLAMHMTPEQCDVHIRSLKVVQKLATQQQE